MVASSVTRSRAGAPPGHAAPAQGPPSGHPDRWLRERIEGYVIWARDPRWLEHALAAVSTHEEALLAADDRVIQHRSMRAVTRIPVGGVVVGVKQFRSRGI